MSDTKHEVKVVVSADVREFQQSMKEARATAEQVAKQQQRFKKNGMKEAKAFEGLQNTMKKHAKKESSSILAHEKQLKAAILQTVAAAKKKLDASKGNIKAIQGEVKALKELESHLANVQKYRKSMGIRTWGERAHDVGSRAGAAGRKGLNVAGGIAIGGIGTLLGMMIGQIGSSYAAAMQAGAAQGGLVGRGSRADLRNPGRGQRFGYDIATTYQQAAQAGQATGNIGAIHTMQAAQRLGLDNAAGYMASIRQGGASFTGTSKGKGEREFQRIIALGMESGIERARLGETIGGVISIMDRQRSISAGDVSGGGLAALAALLGRSGLSGFQGQAGAALLGKLDQGIRTPGGGDAGQAMILQAMGFGNPNGGTSYYDALKSQELGLSDPNNFLKVMREITGQFGRGQERSLAMKSIFNTSLSQSEELGKMFDNGKLSQEELKRLGEIAKDSKSVEERALDAMKEGFGGTIKHIAGLQNRLVGLGNQIKAPIDQMQKDFNDAVTTMWPAVVTSLQTIADAITWIKNFLETKFPDTAKTVNEAQAKLAREARQAAKSGSMSEITTRLRQARRQRQAYEGSPEDLGRAYLRGGQEAVAGNLLVQGVGAAGQALGFSAGDREGAQRTEAELRYVQRQRAARMRGNIEFLRSRNRLTVEQAHRAMALTRQMDAGTYQDTPENRAIVNPLDVDPGELARAVHRLTDVVSTANNNAARGNAQANAGPAPGRTGR